MTSVRWEREVSVQELTRNNPLCHSVRTHSSSMCEVKDVSQSTITRQQTHKDGERDTRKTIRMSHWCRRGKKYLEWLLCHTHWIQRERGEWERGRERYSDGGHKKRHRAKVERRMMDKCTMQQWSTLGVSDGMSCVHRSKRGAHKAAGSRRRQLRKCHLPGWCLASLFSTSDLLPVGRIRLSYNLFSPMMSSNIRFSISR